MSNLNLKGYVSSRPFLDEFLPQQIQNLVIRDFCLKYKNNYLLSAVEYAMNNTYSILEETIENIKFYDGIVCYTLFQLPLNAELRQDMLNRVLKNNKVIHFALEKIRVENYTDILIIESIYQSRISIEKNKDNLENIKFEIMKTLI